jgi:para-aminobenzoate synthetase component 1
MDYRCHLGDIFFTILPAGSVTGAPKKRTTAIIHEVEQSERGYYTGICGIFDGNNVDSAVMIRFIESKLGRLFFRSGGGITFMSKAREEYNELIDKVYVPIT